MVVFRQVAIMKGCLTYEFLLEVERVDHSIKKTLVNSLVKYPSFCQ